MHVEPVFYFLCYLSHFQGDATLKKMVIINSTVTPYLRDVARVHRLSFMAYVAYDGIRTYILPVWYM